MHMFFDIVTDFLSKPLGFLAVHVLMFILYFILPLDIYVMGLSVLAISVGAFVLVSQRKGDLATHLKLDELIFDSDAQNGSIGVEKKDVVEIEERLETIENESR